MIFIEVVVPDERVQAVEPVLAQCCAQVGDLFLGQRRDPETDQHLFLVRLTHDPHLSKHLSVLGQGLEQALITSFHSVRGSVLALSGPDILEHISRFPFMLDDTWVPAIHSQNEVYLCIGHNLLTGQQAAWLHLHSEIRWKYV